MDVVPADTAQWKVDPFAAVIKDGEMWGRGALDMKSLGVMHLLAFLSLKRQGVPLRRDVILMAVPDEETGGVLGAQWMMQHHWAELDPEYVLDEGGIGSPDLFATGKLVFGISVAEKKRMWLKLHTEGIAGHGSQPHDQNANDRLVRALAKLLSEPMPGGSVDVLNAMKQQIGTMAANKFTNAIQHSTIALTTLRSGVGDPPKVNVIPSVAEATIDCRVLPGTTGDQWIRELQRRLGDPGVKIEIINQSDDPVVTSSDTPLYRALAAAIERHNPGAIVSPILVPYGTDANSFRPRGVKSYGIAPVALSADVVASMHGDAEHVPIGDLAKGTRILFEALREVVQR
jgi:acetylornithine deacetylase/succinyl-diaminopimelate desuccinylase-like protein